MTTIYDPADGRYLDEADVRAELTRAFDLCSGCRRCTDRCGAFPTLFDLLEHRAGAGDLTPAEQDAVVGECFGCKLCVTACPYHAAAQHPDDSEVPDDVDDLDVPRLMQRATAMMAATRGGHHRRAAIATLGPLGAVGRLARAAPSLVNPLVTSAPGSLARTLLRTVTGTSSQRVLAPIATSRFSTWFRARAPMRLSARRRRVSVLASCDIEYHAPEVGRDLVTVYERNGVECSLSEAGCCGAHLLDRGDLRRFRATAAANVTALAAEVRAGRDIVVSQPTCAYVIQHDYPVHVPSPDAVLVAEHTSDACDYLIALHTSVDASLDTDFSGDIPDQVVVHLPCHGRIDSPATSARDLVRLTGARVTTVAVCSGMGAGWGARTGNEQPSLRQADRLAAALPTDSGCGDERCVIVSDCHAAAGAIAERSGGEALHPLQVIAAAYRRRP
ncbi:MAG: heterodisulfide reductase-related iron-sulfur binding cluster [Ilumatobacteraceae bacterium]